MPHTFLLSDIFKSLTNMARLPKRVRGRGECWGENETNNEHLANTVFQHRTTNKTKCIENCSPRGGLIRKGRHTPSPAMLTAGRCASLWPLHHGRSLTAHNPDNTMCVSIAAAGNGNPQAATVHEMPEKCEQP